VAESGRSFRPIFTDLNDRFGEKQTFSIFSEKLEFQILNNRS